MGSSTTINPTTMTAPVNPTMMYSTTLSDSRFIFFLYIFQVCRKTKLGIFSNFYLQRLSRLCFICFMLKNVFLDQKQVSLPFKNCYVLKKC